MVARQASHRVPEYRCRHEAVDGAGLTTLAESILFRLALQLYKNETLQRICRIVSTVLWIRCRDKRFEPTTCIGTGQNHPGARWP